MIQVDILGKAASDAVLCEILTEVPAELTLAQWALESGWGTHQPGNNCFGIKAFSGCHGVQVLETFEVTNGVKKRLPQSFATFPSLSDCFQKHSELISKAVPYRHVWTNYKNSKCLTDLIKGIAPIYATAPNYDEKLFSIVRMDNVTAALAGAREHHAKVQPTRDR